MVMDTNIILYFQVDVQWTTQVEHLLIIESHWVVPLRWRSEFRNTRVLYLRNQILSFRYKIFIITHSTLQTQR